MREPIILGVESSCDDTSAAVLQGRRIIANVIANQSVHELYGGVVPELASRAHQQNIVPVIHQALAKANIEAKDVDAIAITRGPGLLGSLLVGTSFTKGFAMGLNIPMIESDHLQSHILAHFIDTGDNDMPEFPFLCLTVSGGHTQIVRVDDYFKMEVIGSTIDDAAGEAFDKAAKILGLPYPGGPVIDRLAKKGNPEAYSFPMAKISGLNCSYSGLKTSFLYFVRDELKKSENFIEENTNDLCASFQKAVVDTLMAKLKRASKETGIRQIAVAGGVSANSLLRQSIKDGEEKYHWKTYIPAFEFTTDNAAMIAISGYFKFQKKDFLDYNFTPYARSKM